MLASARKAMQGGNRKQNRRNKPKKPASQTALFCLCCKQYLMYLLIDMLYASRMHPKTQEERYKKILPQRNRLPM